MLGNDPNVGYKYSQPNTRSLFLESGVREGRRGIVGSSGTGGCHRHPRLSPPDGGYLRCLYYQDVKPPQSGWVRTFQNPGPGTTGGEPNYRTEPNRRELKYRQRRAGQTKKTQNTDRECCQTERLRQKEIDRVTERESDRVTE